MQQIKRIALTAGEPAGIGPDLCIQLAQQQSEAQIIVIADPNLLQQRARQLNSELRLVECDLMQPPALARPGELFYLQASMASSAIAGQLDTRNADYVVNTLQLALDGCLENKFDAVVTAPVHKGIINDAGIEFTGHTEFFADGAGVERVVMMLATHDLRVALATTHLPLKAVPAAITKKSLTQIIQIIHQSLTQLLNLYPLRIAVCGLNPHAGEGGYLGTEELEVIQPVIDSLVKQGLNISGAWPADTIFNQNKLQNYDVVLAMYHDQGLPVLKHHGFGEAVNVTLGLPFIRTSVDHGTALDIAGTGKADLGSLNAAIEMAIKMTQLKN